ncbi:hypothetical protein B0T16DRAFT_50502 [Cercophora newfieldiana]|uniref:Uncharacterized protein n=1 Tax=Cercophora newfieldiana TaxID=92897 RepID=A0AA40CZ65_9PEZI|nr:hypothetical protein B0T16DRAFT_50502 [Cercophora newfieldiana]
MPRLPPAEKLSLALRKNVRDEWDNNKADLEKQLSDVLGEPWTIEVNPLAIWPYHNDGYAKESLGSCIKAYVEGAIYQVKYLTGRYDSLAAEINEIANAKVLTLDADESEPSRFSYSGADVAEGKLRMLFNPKSLGVNIDYSLQEANLFAALNGAPTEKPISFQARLSIRSDYEPTIAATQHQLAEILGKSDDEIKITPNFEDTFAKLAAYKKTKGSDLRDDWETCLGSFTLKYLEGLVWQMKSQKFNDDEMLQEGFIEAVPSLEFVFRIVDKLKTGTYGEVEISDGKLYIQAPAERWGTNVDYIAEKLIDLL